MRRLKAFFCTLGLLLVSCVFAAGVTAGVIWGGNLAASFGVDPAFGFMGAIGVIILLLAALAAIAEG